MEDPGAPFMLKNRSQLNEWSKGLWTVVNITMEPNLFSSLNEGYCELPYMARYYNYVQELKRMKNPPSVKEMKKELEELKTYAARDFCKDFLRKCLDKKNIYVVLACVDIAQAHEVIQTLFILVPEYDINVAVYIIDARDRQE